MSSITVPVHSLQSSVYKHTTIGILYAFDLTGVIVWEETVRNMVRSEKTLELIVSFY